MAGAGASTCAHNRLHNRRGFGTMVSAGAQFLPEMWWEAVMPGLGVLWAILGFNLLGDGLRDVMDAK